MKPINQLGFSFCIFFSFALELSQISTILLSTFIFLLMYLFKFIYDYYPKSNPVNLMQYNKKILPEVSSFLMQNPSKKNKTIIMPLSDKDFDPTEAALAWYILKNDYNYHIEFVTENGLATPRCDMITLKGEGLGFFTKLVFNLINVLVKQQIVFKAYDLMQNDPNFLKPRSWKSKDFKFSDYDGVWIAGGHAEGVKQLLDSEELKMQISEYWQLKRPIAAVCHGVLLIARSTLKQDPKKSVLFGRKTTSLVNYQELIAYKLTAWTHGLLFRTYKDTTEDEILKLMYGVKNIEEAKKLNMKEKFFDEGPFRTKKQFGGKNIGRYGYIVEDGNFLSGRWPGDVEILAHRFAQKLQKDD